jgi:AraC-like DNA-binding protein
MKKMKKPESIPAVRVAAVLRYVCHLHAAGAPVGRLLAHSGIPLVLLEHPKAVIPLKTAFRFGELACKALGTEHLGLYVGISSMLDDLGPYGEMLQRSLTVHEYLSTAIEFFNVINNSQRLWLTEEEPELRFNVATAGEQGIAAHQADLEVLSVTLSKIREAAGQDWSPSEVNFAFRTREAVPDIDLFTGSRVSRGTGTTSFTIPRTLLRGHFPDGNGKATPPDSTSPDWHSLPQDVYGLVRLQIENLLADRACQLETLAETLSTSGRSLQRRLAGQGLSFTQALAETRIHLAARELKDTDKPIAEIAYDLGYADSSNFTRAFRRKIGMSPQSFREAAKGS